MTRHDAIRPDPIRFDATQSDPQAMAMIEHNGKGRISVRNKATLTGHWRAGL
jgi:hypothetical protein